MSREEESGEGAHAVLMQNNTPQVYGYTESETGTGDRTRKKPKNLSVCEREERRYWEGGGVYTTLMESDTLQGFGRAGVGTRHGGRKRKKQKDLSAGYLEDRCAVVEGV